MLTAKTHYNLKNARAYFEEHLCVGDYYDEGQSVAGEWTGLGAQRLGLAGRVRAEDFLQHCENQHLATGGTLTQRLITTRAVQARTPQTTASSTTSHSPRPNRYRSWAFSVGIRVCS